MIKRTYIAQSTLTRFFKANGIDPTTLKGADRIYGENAHPAIRLKRKDVASIRHSLEEGQIVCLKPSVNKKHGRGFEFVNSKFVTIQPRYHFEKKYKTSPATVDGPALKKDLPPRDEWRCRPRGSFSKLTAQKMGIGPALAQAMKITKLRSSELERAIGIKGHSIVHHYLTNRNRPSQVNFEKIVDYFKKTPTLKHLVSNVRFQ